jgi:hypothetical protein
MLLETTPAARTHGHRAARPNWQRVAFWITLSTLIYCWPTEGQVLPPPTDRQPITLDVFPRVTPSRHGRAGLRVRWRILRHPDNRQYTIAWASAWVSGAASRQLDGDNEATLFQRILELPVGAYRFQVCVFRASEDRPICAQQVAEIH